MKKIEVLFLLERIEVPRTRRGRPSYRRTNGYYVVSPDGGKIYPPVTRHEAFDLARSIYGNNIKARFA